MEPARKAWCEQAPDGFSPAIESTSNWAARLGGAGLPRSVPGALQMDRGLDILRADELLRSAGFAARAADLRASLVDAAWQIAGALAGIAPQDRPAWLEQARAAVRLDGDILAFESAVARLALEWAGSSVFPTDVLFDRTLHERTSVVLLLKGLMPEPLIEGLQRTLADKVVTLDWPVLPPGALAMHPCVDVEDEAQRTAACVMAHLAQGRSPVALVALDRSLTRRVHGLLAGANVSVADETGWRLSTTRCAAGVMAVLRAALPTASSDDVLSMLKECPTATTHLDQLEAWLRAQGVRQWRAGLAHDHDAASLADRVDATRARLREPRHLGAWLTDLAVTLDGLGMIEPMRADEAGVQLLRSLRLDDPGALNRHDSRRLPLREFIAWVGETLEASSFRPSAPANAQVVVLPMHQLLGRSFPAAVAAGCDERHLPVTPELPGIWTTSQRTLLGLPSREAMTRANRAAWDCLVRTAHCDVLWRGSDAGERCLPSPLVELWMLDHETALGSDPRAQRRVDRVNTVRAEATAPQLVPERLSASAYADLRDCPYRFFALRMLRLGEADELDADLDQRDYGLWLHEVLHRFHEGHLIGADASGMRQQLDECAAAVTRTRAIDPGEFAPFAAAWPGVRDAYVGWLSVHEADGWRVEASEQGFVRDLDGTDPLLLIGRLDRIDRNKLGELCIIDYKTEGSQRTRERLGTPEEDTQMPFYAALLPEPAVPVRGGYLNLSDRQTLRLQEVADLPQWRDLIRQGISSDISRIRQGQALRALGEGTACEHCAARGLCRRDFAGEE